MTRIKDDPRDYEPKTEAEIKKRWKEAHDRIIGAGHFPAEERQQARDPAYDELLRPHPVRPKIVLPKLARQPSIEKIVEAVVQAFDNPLVTSNGVRENRSTRGAAWDTPEAEARRISYFLAYHLGWSSPSIAKFFGGRTTHSISSAVHVFEKRASVSPKLIAKINAAARSLAAAEESLLTPPT